MTHITLGFRAFDPHELLCHCAAVEAGLYRRERFEVELVDLTFIADKDLPDDWLQASCGAALTSALRGVAQRIVFVAVDRPMFWIWSRTPHAALSALAGRRLATYPATAPPHRLANIVLQHAGLDGAADVTLLPARDDAARLGLLKSGSADAAVISSAVTPERLAALGLHCLCFIGDRLRVPTTGLAASQSCFERAHGQVQALVDIHRQSLARIHSDPDFTAVVLRDWFEIGADIASATAELYATAFTGDGRTSPEIAQGAVDALCRQLEIAPPPAWERIYTFL